MKQNFVFAVGVLSVFVVTLLFSCKKIYMPTDLGLDVIPEVDNIYTFDTTLEVESYNNIFTAANDSFKSLPSDEQFLGVINNDPIFGKTDARMYFQLLSGGQTFYNVPGKRYIDSVVLVMQYLGTYGDTTMPQTIQVSEISPSYNFQYVYRRDTVAAYPLSFNAFPLTNVLGSKTIIPYHIKDSVLLGTDTVKTANQLRIRLDNSFGQRLLGLDSANVANDTLFKTHFNGFALQSVGGGNAIIGFNLLSLNTRLAIYYRYDDLTTAGKLDTTVANFNMVYPLSASANYIGRDYNGTQIKATAGDNVADNLVYIQSTPGTYATLKIPGLSNLGKRIVHLAELQMESVYDSQDTVFTVPSNLLVDAYDATNQKYVSIPYAFEPDQEGNIGNYDRYYSKKYYYYKKDPLGNLVKQWRFNLTRYVQNLLTNNVTTNYDLRLHAPAYMKLANGNTVKFPESWLVSTSGYVSPGIGRVRLGGGTHPTQKMKLRVVYSKI